MGSDSSQKTRILLKCPAKVNLYLEVGRRRSDGYHEISTVFQTVALYDELILYPNTPEFFFKCDSPLEWGRGNTLYRALSIFESHLGKSVKCSIELKKNIPIGGGLGGGSSDAAVLLRYLGVVYRLSEKSLTRMAAAVGSDVPFLLRGGTAIGKGRGELVTFPGDAEGYSTKFAFPGVEVSTKLAYDLVDEAGRAEITLSDGAEAFTRALAERDHERMRTLSVNTFEQPVFDRFPVIASAYKDMSGKKGAILTRMTGSGSTVFSLFEGTENEAYEFVSSSELERQYDF